MLFYHSAKAPTMIGENNKTDSSFLFSLLRVVSHKRRALSVGFFIRSRQKTPTLSV